MKLLAADTGTAYGALAICDGDSILAERCDLLERAHAEKILIVTDELLKSAGISIHDIDALAIAHGPGSFTGLRIGVSTWKGLALGANKPLVGVSSLDAMALIHPREGMTVCPMLDARMGEVYAAAYQWREGVRQRIRDPFVGPVEKFLHELPGPILAYGEGADVFADALRSARDDIEIIEGVTPSGPAVAQEALALLEAGHEADAGMVAPAYLRKSQAELAKETVT